MRIQNKRWIFTLAAAAMLSLVTQSQALYTNYLDVAVATLTGFSNQLANIPTPSKEEKKELAQVKKALKDLSKPSTSVAGDYNLFFSAVLHLGDLAATPTFDELGTNAFNAFGAEAQSEFIETSVGVQSLNPFVHVKKSASNQLFKAYTTLVTLSTTTNKQIGLILGRQVFARLVAAQKLLVKGQAHSGFAANNVVGGHLHHVQHTNYGDIDFTTDSEATDSENGGTVEIVTYSYTRTGLNTGVLVVTESSGVLTAKLKFTSADGGTFTAKLVGDGTESSHGTFTLNF